MAARVSVTSSRKEQLLDVLQENFLESIKDYVSAVKAAIRADTPETADDMFHSAMAFLSQDLPDPMCQTRDSHTKDYGSMSEEMKALKDRVDALEIQVREDRLETQRNCSSLELQVGVSAASMRNKTLQLNRKLESLKNQVKALGSETRESIKDLSEVSNENSKAVKGLRKLQSLLKEKNQAAAVAAAVTPPPSVASASALSRPLKNVRQRIHFIAKVTSDHDTPSIEDVQLLPGGKLLMTDSRHKCVKLFDTQGRHLHSLQCRSPPDHLAVLDSSGASKNITVVVTLSDCSAIDILEVARDDIKIKKTLQMSKKYRTVTAVDKQTLAVADRTMSHPGIDLIDLDGRVLRQICPSFRPLYVDITDDGCLVCSTHVLVRFEGMIIPAALDVIARVQVDTGAILFEKSVPQIQHPHAVAIASDGSILVTDFFTKTLHLVSSQGAWTKQLWSVPSDTGRGKELRTVTTDGSVCVCVTTYGSVYILDCVY